MVHNGRAARLQRRTVDTFRRAGAVAPDRAKTFAQLGLANDSLLRRLVDMRIVREVRAGEFYLDEDAWRGYRATQRRWLLVYGVLMAVAMILAIVLGRR